MKCHEMILVICTPFFSGAFEIPLEVLRDKHLWGAFRCSIAGKFVVLGENTAGDVGQLLRQEAFGKKNKGKDPWFFCPTPLSNMIL